MKIKPSIRAVSRRQFIRGTAAGTLGFTFLPGHVLGLRGAQSPNEKLNIASIGCAGQAASDINGVASENIVALCDVDWNHAAGTFKKFPKAKQYKDFRKMLEEEKGIDAVIVATPDHMHAFASIAAIKLGKHVYCEKPLTHSVWEARQVTLAARAAKVATQMGNQGQASESTRLLCETIWDNAIGAVREAHVWTDRPSNGLFNEYWPQGVARPTDTPPVPATLDWNLWLGPAPARPYHPAYVPFKWRGWWDFGTGALGDIGCHSFDPIFRALKLGAPLSVEASSTRVNEETYPLASMVTYQFPARGAMPPVKLVWYDGGLRPPRPAELEDSLEMGANGALLIGDSGKMLGQRARWSFIPESRAVEYGKPPEKLERSPGHYVEWIQACKGGARKPGSNFDWAGPLAETVLLGNVALRLKLRGELTKQKLLWDPVKFQFTNLPAANQFLRREYRPGWSLG
ncbi:MAG TPA: Gfo/Idh/MocA family oxidoreductase [Verrucomicrobiae bacterium]|jgi:predicted dehydrogenase